MKIYRTVIIVISLLAFGIQADAQKKKAKPKAKAKPAVVAKPVVEKEEPTAADLLFENMLESTQKVFVIDSIVVDKNQFLEYIPLPEECGKIIREDEHSTAPGYVFINEFGNKMYYSVMDSLGNSKLYTADKLGSRWTKGQVLSGLSNDNSPNYPFMMPDGTTFYFAQKGEGSLGGYDIFVTRYDGESGEFLRPNNIGLPFNSKANDYMYVEDELDSLGWFVSDRNQPEGKVCIYTFVPSKKRNNIDISTTDEEAVHRYAELYSIRATWPSKKARDAAMQRLSRMKSRKQGELVSTKKISLVINDNITYHSAEDFRSPEACKLFLQLLQAQERCKADEEQLDALRDRYHEANADERKSLAPTILDAERELEQLRLGIYQLEKQIRNHEIKSLTK